MNKRLKLKLDIFSMAKFLITNFIGGIYMVKKLLKLLKTSYNQKESTSCCKVKIKEVEPKTDCCSNKNSC